MSGYYFFIGAFALLGLYCLVYGAVSLHRLDRSSADYAQLRAKELKNIAGGVILILIGALIYFVRILHPLR